MSHNNIIEMNGYEFLVTNAFSGMIAPSMNHEKTCFAVLEENEELFSAYCHLLTRQNGIVLEMNRIEYAEQEEEIKQVVIPTNEPKIRPSREKVFRQKKAGWVYVLKSPGNIYKIGLTTASPSKRLNQISPKLPFETELLLTIKTTDVFFLERFFHAHFSKKRLNNGSEWFKLNRRDIKYIKKHKGHINE